MRRINNIFKFLKGSCEWLFYDVRIKPGEPEALLLLITYQIMSDKNISLRATADGEKTKRINDKLVQTLCDRGIKGIKVYFQ